MGTYDTRGGSPRHDPTADAEGACDVCGRPAADCKCPACTQCGASGDPVCYIEHGLCRGAGSIEMAYRKGFLARKRAQPQATNPYKGGGSIGLQRYRAWARGWERADAHKPLEDLNG